MDLALELGIGTVTELKQRMTTRELGMWAVYAGRKMLPTRRLEYYLARIAQVTVGGDIEDFVLQRRDFVLNAEPPAMAAASAISAMVGGLRVRHVRVA